MARNVFVKADIYWTRTELEGSGRKPDRLVPDPPVQYIHLSIMVGPGRETAHASFKHLPLNESHGAQPNNVSAEGNGGQGTVFTFIFNFLQVSTITFLSVFHSSLQFTVAVSADLDRHGGFIIFGYAWLD